MDNILYQLRVNGHTLYASTKLNEVRRIARKYWWEDPSSEVIIVMTVPSTYGYKTINSVDFSKGE